MHSHPVRRGSYLVASFAILVALGFVAISAFTTYRFGQLLGTNPTDQLLWGTAGVAICAFKATIPFTLAASWREWRPVAFLAAIMALLICSSYTISASYSVAAAGRAVSTAAAAQERETRARIVALGTVRSEAELAPLIAVERDRQYKAALQAEAARAAELGILRSQLATPVSTSEAAVLSLADVSGWPPAQVRAALLIILALCLEIGEVTGLYLAALIAPPLSRKKEPVQPEAVLEGKRGAVEVVPAVAVTTTQETPLYRPSPAAKGTTTIDGWLLQYLESGPVDITSEHAWSAYSAWIRGTKRKKLARLAFSRWLNEELEKNGAVRTTVAGRLHYAVRAA